MNKIVYRSISVIVSITLMLGIYFSAGASSASVSSPFKTMSKGVSVLAAATPNVGGHIHVEIANHPADGFPIPRKPYTFHVVLKAHNNTGKITSFFVQDGSTNKEKIRVSLGPCVDCSVAFDFTVDFSKWSAGRHELRWHANEADQDPDISGAQGQFTTSRSQICLDSCSPNKSGRGTPFNGGGSWYAGHDYATVYLLSNEVNVKPGGTIIVKAAQDATGACAFLNPDFHNLSSGTTLGCWSGQGRHTITIPSTANVGDRLVLYASDGFNAGVFRMLLGDGTPRRVTLYEFQSWWAKSGFVLPTNGATVPTSTATPIIPLSGTPTATRTATPTTSPTSVPPTVTPTASPTSVPPTVTQTSVPTATSEDTFVPPSPTTTPTSLDSVSPTFTPTVESINP